MNPLCKKIYSDKILEIILLLFCIFVDVMLIINIDNDHSWLIIIIPFTAILIWMTISSIYWAFQPRILIYQYETGIVINRNTKIEYTEIEGIKCKNYIQKEFWGNYHKDPWSGIILIKLKSGKTYKVRNAFYPLEAVDVLTKIKKQKKFR